MIEAAAAIVLAALGAVAWLDRRLARIEGRLDIITRSCPACGEKRLDQVLPRL